MMDSHLIVTAPALSAPRENLKSRSRRRSEAAKTREREPAAWGRGAEGFREGSALQQCSLPNVLRGCESDAAKHSGHGSQEAQSVVPARLKSPVASSETDIGTGSLRFSASLGTGPCGSPWLGAAFDQGLDPRRVSSGLRPSERLTSRQRARPPHSGASPRSGRVGAASDQRQSVEDWKLRSPVARCDHADLAVRWGCGGPGFCGGEFFHRKR